jgi:anti-sigma B factor antagonist
VQPEPFRIIPQAGSRGGQYILLVKGHFSSASSSAFQDAILAAPGQRLIIEMSEVPGIDSMAVGALVRAFVTCNKAGRRLALVGLNYRVQNVLQLTGIDPLFEIYPTVRQAEEAMP